jgi:DNA-directed RNA polymerase subunit H (RpoH/RPB5)
MSEKHQYIPFVIYKNIKKFLEYRNLELVSGYQKFNKGQYVQTKEFLGESEFIKTVQYSGYVQIETKDKPTYKRRYSIVTSETNKNKPVKTFILILDVNSQYGKATQKFTKLINRVPNISKKNRNHNIEILVISKNEFSTHIRRKINTFQTEEPGYVRIFPHKYVRFTTEVPKNDLIPPHRILPEDEIKIIMEELNVTKKSEFPKIPITKPICVWLGANVGDLIEILPLSESVGQDKKYRFVCKL